MEEKKLDHFGSPSVVSVHEAARILNVSPDTIRRWDKKGLIKSERSNNNHRLFRLVELKRAYSKYSGITNGAKFKVLKSRKTIHNVIELFSGCGGMALGFENAGLRTQLLVEVDDDCVDTLRINRPKWNITHDDIKAIDFSIYRGTVDIVAGGFPCQAFSYAGNGKGFEDTRGTLFFEFSRAVKEVNPQIAVAENVRGLLRHDGGKTITTMLNVLDELGYNVGFHLLRSQFLDVPQKRERVIIVGTRKDLNMDFMYPKEKDYTISVQEALRNCGESSGVSYTLTKREIMEHVPAGGYWRDLPIELQREYMKGSFYMGGGKTGMARRLAWDEPSLTLTCDPAQKHTERCHPEETRPLTVREYARIQSFPDNWQFAGSTRSQYKQIGNAVPVNLAYHIGKCLIAMLEGQFDEKSMEIRKPQEKYFQEPLPLVA